MDINVNKTSSTVENSFLSADIIDPVANIGQLLDEATQELDADLLEKNPPFWDIVENKGKGARIVLRQAKFKTFLESYGIFKLYLGDGKSKVMVQLKNNVLKEISNERIKDFVRTYVEGLPDIIDPDFNLTKLDLLEKVYDMAPSFFNDGQLEFLKLINPNYLKDTKEAGYIYFNNCFVQVTSEKIFRKQYKELRGNIWENQKKEHDFAFPTEDKKGDFEQLVYNVCNLDQARFEAMRTVIGYLLHSYKDPSITKAIIFMDETIAVDNDANGGSCKSLVAKGIGMLKSIWYRGKEYKIDKDFSFQGITLATQICLLDDIQKHFRFDLLFTNITNSLTVEPKKQAAYTIDYKDSPKWLITTNYAIKGEGSSYERRRHIVEFSPHYSHQHTPLMEFNRRMFDDWPQEEWNRFYNFMLQCLQQYLKHGLIEVRVNYKERLLLDSTCAEFICFMDSLSPGIDYEIKVIKEQFIQLYDDYKALSSKRFCQWIRLYLKHKNITCQGGTKENPIVSSNGKQFFRMIAEAANPGN